MKFVSNDYVDKVIKKFQTKKEFTKSDFINLNSELNKANIKGTKIKYGYLSKYIRNMSKEIRDNIYNSAETCMDFDIDEENDILVQIVNHIILEVPRANDFDTLHEQSKTYSTKFREYNKDQKDFSKKMDNFESKFSNIQGEFIGILSIFAAVIIGFFGGLNVIGSAMQSMESVSNYRIIFIIILLGMIMFNVIYMLLIEVAKLSNKEKNKDIEHCEQCKKDKRQNIIKCSITKHSYAFYFNLISMNLISIIYILYLVDKYNVISAILHLWKYTKTNIAFIPVIRLLFLTILYFIIRYIYIEKIHKYNCNQEEAEEIDSSTCKATV